MNMLEKFARNHDERPAVRGLEDLLRLAYGGWDALNPEMMRENLGRNGSMAVEVKEKEVVATLPVAGAKGSDFDISVEGDQLTVRIERQDGYEEDNLEKKFLRRERSFSSYSESVKLPVKVKGDKAKAAYRDGVLTVTVPREEPKTAKALKVKVD